MNEGTPTGPDLAPPPPGGGDPTATRRFRLVRSHHDRRLGGVAGGLAVATGLDPTLVRIAFVLTGLSGWGILAYLVAWLLVPEEDPQVGLVPEPAPEKTARRLRIGLAIAAAVGALRVVGAALGVVFGFLSFFFSPFDTGPFFDGGAEHWFPWRTMAGLTLLLAGGLALTRRRRGTDDAGSAGASGFVGGVSGAGAGGGGLSGRSGGGQPPVRPTPGSGPAAAPAESVQRQRAWLLLVARAFGWMSGLWFLGAGAVVTGLWAVGAIDLRWPFLFYIVALGALGTLVVALLRASRLSQVVGALALLLVPFLVALAAVRFDGPVGYRSVAPQSKGELESVYRHGAGELDLDLSSLVLPAGITRVRVEMGAGRVDVHVPWDVNVVASARLRAGTFTLFGRQQSGLTIEGQTRSDGEPGAATLEIDVDSRVGEVLVSREAPPPTRGALDRGEFAYLGCIRTADQISCSAPDGYPTPELRCLVQVEQSTAACIPTEKAASTPLSPKEGEQLCTVPAGGGVATCDPPVAPPTTPQPPAEPTIPEPAPAPGTPTEPGTYLCTIPPGGGPAECRPA